MKKPLSLFAVPLLALGMLAGAFSLPNVSFAQSGVALQTAYQTTFNPSIGSTNTMHAIVQNYTGANRSVHIHLELFNPSGMRIAEQGYDNVNIAPYNIADVTLTSPALNTSGTHTWKVSIFNPGRTGLIAEYNNALTFMVPGTTSGGGTGTTTGDVTLSGSALGAAHMNNCPPVTALLSNSSSNARSVLVDFELRNANGALINQHFTEVTVPANTSSWPLTNICSVQLASGTYTYSIGIFNPGWNGLLHWYSNVQTFSK